MTDSLNWWRDRLKDNIISPLVRDYPEVTDTARPPIDAVESLTSTYRLKDVWARDTVSWRNVFLTAFVALVSRLTGDEDISVGANIGPDLDEIVLRTPTVLNQSFNALLEQVSHGVLESSQHSTSIKDVSSHLDRQTLFRFAAYEIGLRAQYNLESTDLLVHYSFSTDGVISVTGRYNQRLFSSKRIAGVLNQLLVLIQNATAEPSQPIAAIEMSPTDQKQLLPDPSSDLEWSSFRGAINDIFEANAEEFPDRLCVVETKSGESAERRFTYRHINEASNILAHHLVQSGIQRGDVVMIYSYRGVDLVVTVMGVLKAGATFSVLDPAYPPDRQNIYLEVSMPKALIVIAKATEDSGPMSDKVREFIGQQLKLKTEVPALRLEDDGKLMGGRINNKDVLAEYSDLRAKSPGVMVGPDSTPTLSFTSGSEGKPKGVRGRHYSLAFYFDWMAKTFKLSSDDKFTMLSGIAHDPIQRDMFTPLFLGAQLLVPSKEDIQNEKLAEWMKSYGATVTHLTPAMGQILVGGASARFESLHHAFFVGDILIKRDCRSLQNLAPNVNIVNMYGTSETQRAVSFYEIPSFNDRPGYLDSMKDVIPAGQGMYNVQLLVVNRHDNTKLCAVGELGEIYVRASGLAEGYLGTPDLTAKKFVKNWFIGSERGIEIDQKRFASQKQPRWAKHYLGPRDRLYRSGDLGRYTPNGHVECSGRADDQVKIRGFRIELGEIDTHLSQHPLIRENITLVKRDKFEEQILVSYVVPQEDEWKTHLTLRNMEDQVDDGSFASRFQRFQLLRQDIQDYLKTKLPVYAVPSLIVPMKRMPLNPNGKIDKPKLPFPDTAIFMAARRRKSSMMTQLTETELSLAHIWARIIPDLIPRSVKPTDSFFDYGGNSFSAQQLPFQIRRQKGVDISISTIYSKPTLAAIAAYIDSHLDDGSEGPAQVPNSERSMANGDHPFIYAEDAEKLKLDLPEHFKPVSVNEKSLNIFLTGGTGFLGAFILKDIMSREHPAVQRVYCLVRANDELQAVQRLRQTCQAYGVWNEQWLNRIQCLTGDLSQHNFGLSDDQWTIVGTTIDVVVHNGAYVHWIQPYEVLKGPNVLGTITAIKLCAIGAPKRIVFVSSTAVLDSDEFVRKSEIIDSSGGRGILEDDDLSDSQTSLTAGYGQSKWASEHLLQEAGRRGLSGWIVRPGYVLGDSRSGVTNTDDFLIRMLKGCLQLESRPNINNTVNMVPVDHVARTVAACAFSSSGKGVKVAQVTAHPRLKMNEFLATLQTYGYDVPMVDYIPWTRSLEEYVHSKGDQFALMSLFTFVMNDLPTNTRAPELDDSNAEAVLYEDSKRTGEDLSEGSAVRGGIIGRYIAYLVSIGFLSEPPEPDTSKPVTYKGVVKSLPNIEISDDQMRSLSSVGGRGALV